MALGGESFFTGAGLAGDGFFAGGEGYFSGGDGEAYLVGETFDSAVEEYLVSSVIPDDLLLANGFFIPNIGLEDTFCIYFGALSSSFVTNKSFSFFVSIS